MAITNLSQYYSGKGQALPSVQERAKTANQAGIQNYSGTADQNNQLLSYLQKPTDNSFKNTFTSTAPLQQSAPVTGQGMTPLKIPSTIPSQALTTPTTPVPVATPTNTLQNLNQATSNVFQTPTEKPIVNEADKFKNDTMNYINQLTNPTTGEGAKKLQYQTENDIAGKTAKLNNLDLQALKLDDEYQKLYDTTLNKNPEGLFGGGAQQLLNQAQRDLSSKKASLALEKLALQGDLTQANNIIQQKLDAEFAPMRQKLDYLKAFSSDFKNDLTESEKIKLNAQINREESAYKSLQEAKDKAYTVGASLGLGSDFYNSVTNAKSVESVYSSLPKTVTKAEVERLASDEKAKVQLPALQDKLTNIDSLISDLTVTKDPSSGASRMAKASGAVGPNIFSRGISITGAQENFIAGVEQLISQDTIDALKQIKSGGVAGIGNTDKDIELIERGASKIGNWRLKDDNGNVIGYKVTEDQLKKELENIRTRTERVINTIQGSNLSNDELLKAIPSSQKTNAEFFNSLI